MKLIIALFLCGVVYATASPTCSEKQLDECGPYPDGDESYKETEAFLNDVCRSVGCQTDYKRRCGTTGLVPYKKDMVNLAERIYNAMCGPKNRPMRQKYLDNARCINRVTSKFLTECGVAPVIEMKVPSYCLSVYEYISCTTDFMDRECGSDAREVYEAAAPDMEFYGC